MPAKGRLLSLPKYGGGFLRPPLHEKGGIFIITVEEIQKNIVEIYSHPTSLLTLGGLILFILVIMRLRKIELTTRIMSNIGIMLALATVLKVFRLYHLPQGGSVTMGSMIPILLLALFYGPEVGFLAGFLYGMITLILDPYVLHPVQVLFDYPLPFIALGLAGYFRSRPLLGTGVAVVTRFICHFVSGVVFFASYAPAGMSPYWYSFMVNGTFMGLEGVICLLIMGLMPIKRIHSTFIKNKPNLMNS